MMMDKKYKSISFEQAKQLLDEDPDCLMLDVREESEYCVMHADGAIPFPVDSIDKETAAEFIPSFDTRVIVYCKTGSRSCLAAQQLTALGYNRVYDLGSLVGWQYGMAYGAY